MMPERGILGALLASRLDFDAKTAPVAPRITECAEKADNSRAKATSAAITGALGSSATTTSERLPPEPGIGPAREEDKPRYPDGTATLRAATAGEAEPRHPAASTKAHGCSLWSLAGVEVRAFGDRGAGTMLRQVFFRAAMLLSLIAYAKRVHPSGQALCLLWLRPWRFLGAIATSLLVVCITGAIYPLLGVVLIAAIAAVLLPCSIGAVKSRPGWKELSKLTPPGRHIYVHSVASQLPGAGAELLRALAIEADEQRWSLVLDASNEKLVRYYEQFGFGPLGPGVQMPDGARHVRMWRPPITP